MTDLHVQNLGQDLYSVSPLTVSVGKVVPRDLLEYLVLGG